ncbi:hypothetical protein Tcan_02046 [Toxocara canis]|uniref:Uncharacterized protein n=1 Tax=Toxocara canis TaxID=6265 RepID=A0A0B2USG2_TOXCA|nr:hypothetical protein Tcan_02046 [Toxocara canis]
MATEERRTNPERSVAILLAVNPIVAARETLLVDATELLRFRADESLPKQAKQLSTTIVTAEPTQAFHFLKHTFLKRKCAQWEKLLKTIAPKEERQMAADKDAVPQMVQHQKGVAAAL